VRKPKSTKKSDSGAETTLYSIDAFRTRRYVRPVPERLQRPGNSLRSERE
jgi:hypothetical protein